MGTQVKVELSPDQILKTRGLQVGGPAQRFFTGEFRRKMDPYVPFLTGVLKDTAIENVDSIQFVTPYAQKQYHENKGNGTSWQRMGSKMLGRQWRSDCSVCCRFCRR